MAATGDELSVNIKLLVTVHERIAEMKKLANREQNDWRYSNRLGQYAHSRN